jgi:alpha-mannosidase
MGTQDMPAQRWVDLSGADGAGVTLVNSSKYGFSVEEQGAKDVSLEMTLLRASIDPDPLPDLGEHIIGYALVPHGTEWTVGDCFQAGEMWNVPLVVSSCGFHHGALPPVGSLMSIENKNVRLAALKGGQDGRSIILRLIEVEGTETRAQVALSSELLAGAGQAVEVDAMERMLEENSASLHEGILSVDLSAYGVTTVRLEA